MTVDPRVAAITEATRRHMASVDVRLKEQRETLRVELRSELRSELRDELLVELRGMIPPPVPGPAGERGPVGEVGMAGKDGAPGEAGKDGRDGSHGNDGKGIDPAEVRSMVLAEVGRVVAAIPAPKDGADGKSGRDGADGKSFEPESVAGLISVEVRRAVSELPPPRDGRDGMRGDSGRDGVTMEQVEAASQRIAAEVLRSITIEGRTLKLGERTARLPIPEYRGVYREGEAYGPGDLATFGGSLWHANEDTKEKPGSGPTTWQLVAKAGRDGKDLRDPESRPKPGPVKVR